MMNDRRIYPMGQALLAAILFGASAPLAKMLLGEIEPISLAAFLYLGSGIGVLLFKLVQQARHSGERAEAQITRADWKWLAGAVFAGGVAAPIILFFGLRNTPASTASLLLNFEGVATTVIAALVFKEAIGKYALWSILCVTAASIVLSWDASGQWGVSAGALGILAACVLWGVDNNLTGKISAKDPLVIVLVKGFGAGSFSLLLSRVLGQALPRPEIILGALGLGSLSYGMSIVLFIHAMRGMGAARTSAIFGSAPLVGMVLSLVLFRDPVTLLFGVGLILMVAGAFLLIREQHRHQHVHEAMTHDHRHRHDDGHHNHDHPYMTSRSLTHSHPHTHERLEHEHAHLPDIHHRHSHT
jgi:drug/metabolite transporter (DMT)-like permease